MKHWQETLEIALALRDALSSGTPCALAVVTEIDGSTYRSAGAKLLIQEDGSMRGNVSGGCLEDDIRETAIATIKSGEFLTKRYKTGDDEDALWGMGLGCDGEVHTLIVPMSEVSEIGLESLIQKLHGDVPLEIDYKGSQLGLTVTLDGELPLLSLGPSGLAEAVSFEEALTPPPRLFICGGGDDAIPLSELASRVGFRVWILDHRASYLAQERFPLNISLKLVTPEEGVADTLCDEQDMVVIKTHSLKMDANWANVFLQQKVRYIGLLGPATRRDEILAKIPPADQSRIYGPVGLDLGGEGPEQVSLSIVSELMAVLSGKKGGHLRSRKGSCRK